MDLKNDNHEQKSRAIIITSEHRYRTGTRQILRFKNGDPKNTKLMEEG